MKRRFLQALLLPMLAISSGAFAQDQPDEPSPAARLAGFEKLFGEWSASDPIPTLLNGDLLISIRPVLNNNHVLISVRFKPTKGEEFELLQLTAGWSPIHQQLRFRAAEFDGEGAGTVVFDGDAVTLDGNGVRFNGQKVSRTAVYSREAESLVIHLTESIGGRTDEQRIVLHARDATPGSDVATEQESPTADELQKELQGSWKHEQANGRWTVKTVTGLTDKLTRYDANGNATHAHESEFELSEHSGIREVHLKRLMITEGPDKGLEVPAAFLDGYVYKIEGDELIEAQGLKAGGRKLRIFRWKRIADADK